MNHPRLVYDKWSVARKYVAKMWEILYHAKLKRETVEK
jgi:hypothetical protein